MNQKSYMSPILKFIFFLSYIVGNWSVVSTMTGLYLAAPVGPVVAVIVVILMTIIASIFAA